MSKSKWLKPKRCNRCGTKYPRTSKYWSKKGYDGGYCKPCAMEAQLQYSQKKHNYESRRWLHKKLTILRERAARKKVPFDLDVDYLEQLFSLTHCEFTGIKFEESGPFLRSVDRVDPSLGYVKGNVRMVVFIHNAARGKWGDEALAKYVAALVRNRRRNH